ncbi:MAG: PhoH family protein [candidate division KSB1 bacterium]|nr:PhoH family protein [candidate division KSB1 bacterium]MDZ7337786.1 PhoH family protein [candidate division KSB1 bacterium]MDZ7378084.1 PhoH family protein [candidate division KSB1 bacterium]MDZ7384930.1 PhoH family protein [candidate division KSB1 bacterium]MDZ7391984.1 PhoH family protein [candidate division KSB1 bacterium]
METQTEEKEKQTVRRIPLPGVDQVALFGSQDAHLKLMQREFGVQFVARGAQLLVRGSGHAVELVERVLSELLKLLERGGALTVHDVNTVVGLVKNSQLAETRPPAHAVEREPLPVVLMAHRGPIRPRSEGQARYVRLVADNDIVFAIGPAGTGKTYLAVAMAVAHLQAREVERIILARPAVEAGESLGFLPGDLKEKVDPYLRPLYDALYDMLPAEKLRRFLEVGVIEIVPLAYMRGRTLNHAFVILDEAQNSTALQMKMFLTRLGIGSKAIVTGDITQIDLPSSTESGLVQIQRVVAGIEGIAFAYLTDQDVVRHRLVRDIIRAYDNFQAKTQRDREAGEANG